jgi:hypothetical protein
MHCESHCARSSDAAGMATDLPPPCCNVRSHHSHVVIAIMNFARPLRASRRLHLEVVFVNDAAGSDIQVQVSSGNGRAHLNKWYVDGNPTTHAHEITHGAFGIKDEYVDSSG